MNNTVQFKALSDSPSVPASESDQKNRLGSEEVIEPSLSERKHHKLFIDQMWSAVMENSDFRPMIKAWDAAFFSDSGASERRHKTLLQQLTQDMQRLDSALESKLAKIQVVMQPPHTNDRDWVELSSQGEVLAASAGLIEAGFDRSEHFEYQLSELDLSLNKVHLIMSPSNQGARLLALVPVSDKNVYPKRFLIELSERFWREKHSTFVKKLLGLSDTELEVTKLVYAGHESAHIAELRHRSVYTIRKQVKSILEKASVSSQRQLVQLLASILMMVDRVDHKEADTTPNVPISEDGGVLGFDVFGAPDGRLMFVVCPTLPSTYFSRWQQSLVGYGIKLVVAHRSRASAQNYSDHAKSYIKQLSALFRSQNLDADATVLGVASGGVYATQLAVKHRQDVSSLVCVDTGYPRTHIRDFLSLPTDTRRTFIPARYAHRLLLTPHKIVANDFFSSKEGEQRVMEFFFKGQPNDAARLAANTALSEDLRQLISYSLSEPEQLVYNVTHWVKDWSEDATELGDVKALTILGADNALFANDKFESWAVSAQWLPVLVKGEGQLMLFSLGDNLLSLIARHLSLR